VSGSVPNYHSKVRKFLFFSVIWLQVPTIFAMLLIYTSTITNRLRYIADLLVRVILGVEVQYTISPDEYNNFNGPKLSYTKIPLYDGIFIEASSLLFEDTIFPREILIKEIDRVPIIFTNDHPDTLMPFDPFAASFYLLSRYEEYLPHQKDRYGRFPATESIAFRGAFLQIPVVHLWAAMFGKLLIKYYPRIKFRSPDYRYVPTIDVDHAYCYRGRSLTRSLGGIGRDLLQGHFSQILFRMNVLSGLATDPYDNYSFLNRVHGKYPPPPLYFILFADDGGEDNNIRVKSKLFQMLLSDLDQNQTVGIHPSLSSNKKFSKLQKEFLSLCRILDRNVTISRQHFLHLTLPHTYLSLIQLGIKDDYSLGYPSHLGFRAGIAIPFQFFDLTNNEPTSLMVHPVPLMDVTMKDFLRLSTDESMSAISHIISTIKSVNGEFVSLWHNESLGETGRWVGWRGIYEEMVKLAST
jgi:hypothetical protein